MRDGSVELYYAHFYDFKRFSWRNCLFSARKMTFFIPFFRFWNSSDSCSATSLFTCYCNISSSSLFILPYSLLFVICTVPSIFETYMKIRIDLLLSSRGASTFQYTLILILTSVQRPKKSNWKVKKIKRNQICTGSHVTVQPFYLAAVVAAAIYIH